MSNIRELSLDEIALVSGDNVSDRAVVNNNSTNNGYREKANGFQPNYATDATDATDATVQGV
ncbi:hypothetical protein RHD99_11745 [Buttiauxella selenatireducens]|uniref:Uncharacterized protein n=1 Tax=Buttiauxella selenatireducens TaxID=3073902 RepID=A0ABY9SGB8_9ENTR|nr:hypothetical protein [Buttiauxella sp. R73]WMY76547.1 hypothetical protein RHD99_11745 [Buttiauxella sp. R73]